MASKQIPTEKICVICDNKFTGITAHKYCSVNCRDKYLYYDRYRYSASKRGLEFKITHDEFYSFMNAKCYYCDEQIQGIGLDRKDNNIGYLFENVVSCCKHCNWAKFKQTESGYIERCKKVYLNSIK